jgi:hypothetical protein
MQRRAFLMTALLSATSLTPATAATGLQIIYVGGWDCPVCAEWKKNNKSAWLASPEYKQVTYTEVDAPHLKDAYQEKYWAGDLKPVREQLKQKWGTPRFVIVKNGEVMTSYVGHWGDAYADIKRRLQ